jgi:hypothetical protein
MTFLLFFSLGSSIAGLCIIILLIISSQKFLKGEVRKFIESMMLGTAFLYSFTFAQVLTEFLSVEKSVFDVIKGVSLFLAFVFFIFSTAQIYEISKVLGFASKKTPKKLKKILKS